MTEQQINIMHQVEDLLQKYGTRDPAEIADALGITILLRDFHTQKGVAMHILGMPFILLQRDLPPEEKQITLAHEIAHLLLHPDVTLMNYGGKGRYEAEANLFAALLLVPSEDLIPCIEDGTTLSQAAGLLHTDPNLIAIRTDFLIAQGHHFRHQDYVNTFLGSTAGKSCRQDPAAGSA